MKNKLIISIIAIIIVIVIAVPLFFVSFEETGKENQIPTITIDYPVEGDSVARIVTISGFCSDPDGVVTIKKVEIMIETVFDWKEADGTEKWSYNWDTYNLNNGFYKIKVRAWDGADYSNIEEIKVIVKNSEIVESDQHKWAVFIIAANFPKDNESKLGNGGLYLAEEMSAHFIENCSYPTSNIIILFDDGWIRSDGGFGDRLLNLQNRYHKYNINYAAATKENVKLTLENIIEQSNEFSDSEVFIWIASHGCGDSNNQFFGGKVLERSAIFLWDDILEDNELGVILNNLKSRETCIIVDACFSGGFADKTIFNIPTFFLLKSNIPDSGRVVITGSSKYRVGYASIERGPLFSLIWFDGIVTGKADGFIPGFLKMGRPTILRLFKDGKVSVEEAFYYARYILKNEKELDDFSKMEPQMNDQYPNKGFLFNRKGLILG